MKKTLAAALAAIVLAAALTGCNNSTSEGSGSNNSQNDSNNSQSGTSNAALTLTASEMAERALGHNPNNWSMAMMPADDEMFSILLPDLSTDMFEDYCFYCDMIGIAGHEVFVGKPKAGQEDAVKAAFEKSLDSLKDRVSFYPAGADSVEGAVSGTTSHGYVYFIIHPDGEAVASAMVDPNAPTVDFSNRGDPEDENPSDDNPGDETPVLEFPANQAGDMVRTALAVNPESWSEGMEIATNEELTKVLKSDIKAEMFEEFCFAFDTFGIGHTVFVGKAKAGQEEAVKAAVETAFDAYKAEIAMFPDGAELTGNAVSGSTDDGYLYFVIHADGAAIASAMTSPVF